MKKDWSRVDFVGVQEVFQSQAKEIFNEKLCHQSCFSQKETRICLILLTLFAKPYYILDLWMACRKMGTLMNVHQQYQTLL